MPVVFFLFAVFVSSAALGEGTAPVKIVAPSDMWWCNLPQSEERRLLCISHESIQQEQHRKAAEKH